MKKYASILIAMLLLSTSVNAQVASTQIPAVVTEETVLTIKSKTLTSKANPLKVTLVTADGTVTTLPTVISNNKTSAQVQLPSIPDSVDSLLQVTIKVSGGDVSAAAPQEFARILAKKPAGFVGDGNIAGVPPSLPNNTISGIIQDSLQGPAGPAGPAGAVGPKGIDGTPGPQGPIGPIPPNYPGANIIGDVATAAAFTGVLAGDVTGPMSATAISNATITNKQLNGAYVPAAGVVALGDSLQTAIAKLDGNVQANDGDISTIYSTLGTPTSSNTVGAIVQRDGSGDFAANIITANSFSGPLTGNVTGNVTGQVVTPTQSSITTLPAAISIGTSGITTTFSGPIAAPEGITGPISGAVTGNVTGNLTGNVTGNVTGDIFGDVLKANQHSIARMNGLIRAGSSGIKTTFLGPVNGAEGFIGNIAGNLTGTVLTATQNSIATMTGLTNVGTAGVQTQFQGPVRGNQGFIGDITGNVTGNVNGNVNGTSTNATNAANVTGASQPGITSLGGIAQLGSFGNTANFGGSVAIAQNLNVTGALVAGSLSSAGTITAPKFVGTFQGNVLTTSQPLIATLAGLTSAGTAGVTTTFSGPVAAPQGVTANVLGNLTGNVTGNVSGTAGALANTAGTGALTYDGTAGNFSSVLRTTANTDLTLPTTGTLATRAGAETFTNKTIDAASNTLSNIGTTSISNDAITYAKLQNVSATDKLLARVSAGAGDVEEFTFTDFAQSLVDDADAATARTTLGLGTIATLAAPTGTVVGTTDAQLLTNKTLEDSTVSFVDEADNSKAVKLELTGITAATTRTITVPDADLTIVGTTTTQTLTNKTIDAASNTLSNIGTTSISDNAVTYAKLQDVTATDKLLARVSAGSGDVEEVDFSDFAQDLVNDADATTARTTLGLGTIATAAAPAGTIVGTSDTQALSNKTLEDATVSFIDDGDNTKVLKLELSGITTATTRTLTAPNASGTIATTTGLTPMAIGSVTQVATDADVTGLNFVKLTAIAADLETLTGGVDGQKVTILFVSVAGNSVVDGFNIELDNNAAFAPNAGSVLELIYDATSFKWYEVSRSGN